MPVLVLFNLVDMQASGFVVVDILFVILVQFILQILYTIIKTDDTHHV